MKKVDIPNFSSGCPSQTYVNKNPQKCALRVLFGLCCSPLYKIRQTKNAIWSLQYFCTYPNHFPLKYLPWTLQSPILGYLWGIWILWFKGTSMVPIPGLVYAHHTNTMVPWYGKPGHYKLLQSQKVDITNSSNLKKWTLQTFVVPKSGHHQL